MFQNRKIKYTYNFSFSLHDILLKNIIPFFSHLLIYFLGGKIIISASTAIFSEYFYIKCKITSLDIHRGLFSRN